ncbi:MAG: pilus assembly protein TadG-related protein [Rhodomicrobium sp.]
MFRSVWAKLSAFKAGTRGVVLYLVALLIVPFVVLIGVAVDMGQLLVAKNQLSSAIDAAALDIGANPLLTQAQAQTQAQAYINANFATQYPNATLTSFTVTLPQAQASGSCLANSVCITASLSVNTSFLQIINYNTLTTTVSTQVTSAANKLEVVLVLDNTTSMNSTYGSMTGMAGLRLAATTLVNTLFAAPNAQQYVKVAIVPFTTAVNVGTQYANASWIDNTNGAGSLSQENINVPTGTSLITYATNLAAATGNSVWKWGGCVRQRTEPYDLQDVAPASGDTLFTPFFAPDEPDCCSTPGNTTTFFNNSYLAEGPAHSYQGPPYSEYVTATKACTGTAKWPYTDPTTESNVQLCTGKYTTSTKAMSNTGSPQPYQTTNGYQGPNMNCTVAQIIPLTNNQSVLLNEISAMTGSGNTVIPAGLVWGWHAISPNVAPVVFPGNAYQPVPYSDTSTIKVIILMTDGQNDVWKGSVGSYTWNGSAGSYNGFNGSVFNSYGYGNGPHLSTPTIPSSLQSTQDQPDYVLDQKEIALCNYIKAVTDANGKPGRILLYAIGYGDVINNSSLQNLQGCATSASTYFYEPTADELVTTFQNIAVGLSQLRIAR